MLEKTSWTTLAGALAIVCALTATGYGYYFAERTALRRSKLDELRAIALSRSAEITRWREERLQEAHLYSSTVLRRLILSALAGQDVEATRAELLARMKGLQANENYENVILAAPDGTVLAAAGTHIPELQLEDRRLLSGVLAAGEARLGEPFRCRNCGEVHLDVAAQILDDDARPVALLLLRIDPEAVLFPLVQSWPIPSASAETLLVRRDGDEALLMNTLRFGDAPALTRRFPLSATHLPAVQAAKGRTGTFEGRDYRGMPVVAELLPVAGSTWLLVAKVDQAEIFAEISVKAIKTFVISLLAILLVATVGLLGVRGQRQRMLTALLRAEQQRREAAEEFRVTLYSIGDGVITTDPELRINRLNPVAEALTGWTEAAARDQPLAQVFRIINEETNSPVESPAARVLQEGRIVGLANHTVLLTRDGRQLPIADSAAPILDERGAVRGVILVFRDQAEERAAAARVREEMERANQYFDIASFLLVALDCEGRIVRLNRLGCELLGCEEDTVLGSDWFERFVPEAHRTRVRAIQGRVLAGSFGLSERVESPVLGPRGEERLIVWHNAMVRDGEGRVIGTLSSGEDITERRRSERRQQRLQHSVEAQLKLLASRDATEEVLLASAVESLARMTDSGLSFLGRLDPSESSMSALVYSSQAMQGCAADLPTRFDVATGGLWAEPIRQRRPIRLNDYDESSPWKRGTPQGHVPLQRFLGIPALRGERIVLVAGLANKEEDYDEQDQQEATLLLQRLVEILGRRDAERSLEAVLKRLQAREAQQAAILDNIPDMAWVKDLDGRLLAANAAYARSCGRSLAAVVGLTDQDLWPAELAARYRADDQEVTTTGRAKRLEEPIQDAAGRWIWVETIKTPVCDQEGRVIGSTGIARDITDYKLAEAQRLQTETRARQQQKLEAIGTLASGVAHEINNPLNVILNYGQVLLDDPGDLERTKDSAENIVRESERVALIVRNLLSFARQDKESHSPARVIDLVERSLLLTQAVLRKDHIEVRCEIPEELPDVPCRSQQIQQVVLNLLTNARDALNLRYPNASPDKVLRIVAALREEQGHRWVRLTVEDHGIGIAPEVSGRVFDPFFTTKPRDQGTGLGLSISHGIIHDHGGSLWFESEPGQGTRFHLELPLVDTGGLPSDPAGA